MGVWVLSQSERCFLDMIGRGCRPVLGAESVSRRDLRLLTMLRLSTLQSDTCSLKLVGDCT